MADSSRTGAACRSLTFQWQGFKWFGVEHLQRVTERPRARYVRLGLRVRPNWRRHHRQKRLNHGASGIAGPTRYFGRINPQDIRANAGLWFEAELETSSLKLSGDLWRSSRDGRVEADVDVRWLVVFSVHDAVAQGSQQREIL